VVSICQECRAVIGVSLKVQGKVSHGLCIDCNPAYLRRNGVSEEEIEEFMENFKEEEGNE